MFYLLLDILIYNYTPYLSYFFILNINNKPFIYNIIIAVIIDILLKIPFYNVIFITIIYLLKKHIFKFNYNNLLYYYIVNISFIILYYIISSLIYSSIDILNILNLFFINSIFILICYKKDSNNILLLR